ncbi:hypothetical protein [Sorangium sp. So ce131]|uniref:hypothetical protein n=1 Tax=Sorangium sp. So ce131 TaxID=3133282 RepID=UPI003F612A35
MKKFAVVTTLISVSLCAGAAFAEGPRAARAPRHLDVLRSRGDIVDRSYRHAQKEQAERRLQRVERADRGERAAPSRVPRGQERIRCADTGMDCASRTAAAQRSRSEVRDTSRPAAAGASPLKSRAEARMHCSDAGECAASSAGARRAWAGRSARPAAAQAREHTAVERAGAERQSPRMSCGGEGEECAMSSKEAAKFWAAESIKAGTQSPAQIASERAERARRIAERQRDRDARRARSDSASK